MWARHGTPELAKQAGLLDSGSQAVLQSHFRARGLDERQAWREVHRLRWVAIYNAPDRTKIFLYDLIAQPSLEKARGTLQMRQSAEARGVAFRSEVTMVVSAVTKVVEGVVQAGAGRIERSVDQTHATIAEFRAEQAEANRRASEAARDDAVAHGTTHLGLGAVEAKIEKNQLAYAVAHEKTQQAVSSVKADVAETRSVVEAFGQHTPAPAGGRGRKVTARRRGRPTAYDSGHDLRLLKEWRGARKTNPGLPMEEFAREKGMSRQRLEKALQRARARERRIEPPSPS